MNYYLSSIVYGRLFIIHTKTPGGEAEGLLRSACGLNIIRGLRFWEGPMLARNLTDLFFGTIQLDYLQNDRKNLGKVIVENLLYHN
jgi:hypothetical protein